MIKHPYFIVFFIIPCMCFSTCFAGQNLTLAENHNVSSRPEETHTSPLLYPIKFYSTYLSRIDGNRCPMYPSCSQYCMEAVKKHGAFLGWIMCSDRLMRCGRDELKLSAPVWINGEKRTWDPVSNNDFWWQ